MHNFGHISTLKLHHPPEKSRTFTMPESHVSSPEAATRTQALSLTRQISSPLKRHDSPLHLPPSSQLHSLPLDIASLIEERSSDPNWVLTNPHYNKGTAFSVEERRALGLDGLLPHSVETIDVQMRRSYRQFSKFTAPMAKYIYLNSLKERNETLFYKLLMNNLSEMMPFIYTPTVGYACQEYGLEFRHAEGMYISIDHRHHIRQLFDNWRPNILDEVSIIVVTDGSRILGLGDLGAGGMGIPVGKLSLYVAAGGFHPSTTLPIVIDVGTNNPQLLSDEFYLGYRSKRLGEESYYELIEEFMTAVKDKWPACLVQFEDFSNDHCFELLDRYRERQLCFNDDIQGTGAVVAAGFINALSVTHTPPENSRILFVGAGAAGIGVADQIGKTMVKKYHLSVEKSRELFYIVDSKGLVTDLRGPELQDYKKPYSRHDVKVEISDLFEIVKYVRPTALIGLSGQPDTFTEDIIKYMGEINERPIIFPLSNPTVKAECSFEDAFTFTSGRVVFASGSPFPSKTVDGVTYYPSQGNNLYTFPGIGFGSWLCGASKVTDDMITAGTLALCACTTEDTLNAGSLFPPLATIRDVTVKIAAAVIRSAVDEGVLEAEKEGGKTTGKITKEEVMSKSEPELEALIRSFMYQPEYMELKYKPKGEE